MSIKQDGKKQDLVDRIVKNEATKGGMSKKRE